MHFFSPVDKMPLVELIVGEQTSDAALARAYDVVRQIGKTPIVVQDSRGFFTSRVFGTLVLEGAALLAEGLAPMSIERAALQAGFPAGPLTLLDEVTLTLPLKISDEAAKAGSTEDHPGLAVVRALVEQGPHRQGVRAAASSTGSRRSGCGRGSPSCTRRTTASRSPTPRSGCCSRWRWRRRAASRSGCCTSVEDANIGSIMGIGFPPLYGGVLQYVDQYAGGVAGFVARADELADAYGERFRPPALLLERAVPAGSVRAAVAAA